jgi:hypothetical protein
MKPFFPGMNPYLEDPELWVEVHSWLMVLMARSLNPQLTPKYRAAVEKRVYADAVLVGIPDVSVFGQSGTSASEALSTATLTSPLRVAVPMVEEVRESYLEIREVATGRVVTVIELLSPKNKRSGEGRNQYTTKRNQVLGCGTNLVEIDLLRLGEALPVAGGVASDYRILVSRSRTRPDAELYAFNLRDQLPVFPLPLELSDREPFIDLSTLLDQVYDEAALELAIDYHQPPRLGLKDEDWVWVRSLLPFTL